MLSAYCAGGVCLQAAELTANFIGQLEALGSLEHWTVYAALHLPDSGQRTHAVTELLCRQAPVYAADTMKRNFLLQVRIIAGSCWRKADSQSLKPQA